MVNYKNILIGNLIFVLAYFFLLITQYVVPPLASYLDSTLGGVVWLGTFILSVTAILLLPIGFIYMGLTKGEPSENKMLLMGTGIIHGILAITLIYLSWYAITPMAEALELSLFRGMFWIGLVIIYIANTTVIPALMIIEAKNS